MSDAQDFGSITRLLAPFKANDPQAAAEIWQRYRQLLVALADRWLGGLPRRAVDEDDIAQAAFLQCWKQVTADKYPALANREDLERILRDLVGKTAMDHKRNVLSLKRGGGRVLGESAILMSPEASGFLGVAGVAERNVLTPDELAEFNSTWTRLFEMLTENERAIAVARLADFTVTDKELAEQFECSVSLIRLRLKTIRKKWQLLNGDAGSTSIHGN